MNIIAVGFMTIAVQVAVPGTIRVKEIVVYKKWCKPEEANEFYQEFKEANNGLPVRAWWQSEKQYM